MERHVKLALGQKPERLKKKKKEIPKDVNFFIETLRCISGREDYFHKILSLTGKGGHNALNFSSVAIHAPFSVHT